MLMMVAMTMQHVLMLTAIILVLAKMDSQEMDSTAQVRNFDIVYNSFRIPFLIFIISQYEAN